MIDVSHLPDNKYTFLLKSLTFILAVFDINTGNGVIGFFMETLIWGARIFVIISGIIFAYNSLMAELRYRAWAKTNYDPKRKNEFRIK